MQKKTKKLTWFLLLSIIFGVLTLGSCGVNVPSDEECAEILSALSDLYPKSLELNNYIFGDGLEASDPDADSDGKISPLYVDVAESSPYKTKAELEAAILSVYSESYYNESLRQLLFDGYEGNDKLHPRYRETKGVLQFDITSEAQFSDLSGRFELDKAKVLSVSSDTAVVECLYTRGEYSDNCTLTLARTENGWRFAVPTI